MENDRLAAKEAVKWNLVNPIGIIRPASKRANRHPTDFTGKRVLLYWSGKPNGDIFLEELAKCLEKELPGVQMIKAWEVNPETRQNDQNRKSSARTAKLLTKLKPDFVIGGIGDCGGSSTWLLVDQLFAEQEGFPTMTLVTQPYLEMANSLPPEYDMAEMCIVEVPHPLAGLSRPKITANVQSVLREVIQGLTQWQPSEKPVVRKPHYSARNFTITGTVEDVHSRFIDDNMSLGLPIIPPTLYRVKQILQGTRRKPDEVIGFVPPRLGVLTVELLAANAVMAGCRREDLPLLIAVMEALLTQDANWRIALSTTGTSQTMIIVNGPVIQEIGLASGQGAAGKGNPDNGSIGYAINLIAYNVGGSRPPAIDKSTLGSPADYICWVFGENEAALPTDWKPLHVDLGFDCNTSVVTVMASYPPVENNDHWSTTAEEHLAWWGRIAVPLLNMGGPCFPPALDQRPVIALSPEHARLIAKTGLNKAGFCQSFWEHTRIPLSAWPHGVDRTKLAEKMGPLNDNSLVPVCLKPEQLLVCIAGGDGMQSHYFAPFPASMPVSKQIM